MVGPNRKAPRCRLSTYCDSGDPSLPRYSLGRAPGARDRSPVTTGPSGRSRSLRPVDRRARCSSKGAESAGGPEQSLRPGSRSAPPCFSSGRLLHGPALPSEPTSTSSPSLGRARLTPVARFGAPRLNPRLPRMPRRRSSRASSVSGRVRGESHVHRGHREHIQTASAQPPRRRADELLSMLADRVGAQMGASTIYGTPVERDGVTVIPVAVARCGIGAGSGSDPSKRQEGEGGGGGGTITLAGYIELKDGPLPVRSHRPPRQYARAGLRRDRRGTRDHAPGGHRAARKRVALALTAAPHRPGITGSRRGHSLGTGMLSARRSP
jgi:hypothetical protein